MTGVIQKFNNNFPVYLYTTDYLMNKHYFKQWFQSICSCNSSQHNYKFIFH